MKGLLILLVVLVGVWFWRNRASAISQRPPAASDPMPMPLDTVACSRCHVHIPRAEAIQGRHGSYCGQEHLDQSEP